MLVSTCTQCRARFRVTPTQLNAKQGQVRCGRCGSVFNGFEALERFPDDDTGARLLAAREAAERAANIAPPHDPLPFDELPDIETLQSTISSTLDEGATPFVDAPARAPSTPPAPRRDKDSSGRGNKKRRPSARCRFAPDRRGRPARASRVAAPCSGADGPGASLAPKNYSSPPRRAPRSRRSSAPTNKKTKRSPRLPARVARRGEAPAWGGAWR